MKKEKKQRKGFSRTISDFFRVSHLKKGDVKNVEQDTDIAKRIDNTFGQALKELAKR